MAKDTTHNSSAEDAELQELEAKVAADEWSGSAPRQAKNFWPSAKRLLLLLMPYKRMLAVVAAMNIVCVFLAVFAPKILGDAMDVIFSGVIARELPSGISAQQAIDGMRAQGQDQVADMASGMDFTPGEGIDFTRLGTLIIAVIAMYIVSAAFELWQGLILNRLTIDTVYELRQRVEAKVHALPLNYFDSRQRGDILSRTTNDIDNVQQALQQALSQLFYNILMILGITVMMLSISWQLALVALLALPLTALIIGVIGGRSQRQFKTQWRATGQLNGQVEESFSGHDLGIVFGRTEAMTEEFDKRNEELYHSAAKAQFLSGIMMPIMQFLSYLSYVAIAVLGGLRVANGHMTLGAATAFIQYSREFNQPLGQLGGMATAVQSGTASAERIFELLDAEALQAVVDRPAQVVGRAVGVPAAAIGAQDLPNAANRRRRRDRAALRVAWRPRGDHRHRRIRLPVGRVHRSSGTTGRRPRLPRLRTASVSVGDAAVPALVGRKAFGRVGSDSLLDVDQSVADHGAVRVVAQRVDDGMR